MQTTQPVKQGEGNLQDDFGQSNSEMDAESGRKLSRPQGKSFKFTSKMSMKKKKIFCRWYKGQRSKKGSKVLLRAHWLGLSDNGQLFKSHTLWDES